jgi:hypothetical protein
LGVGVVRTCGATGVWCGGGCGEVVVEGGGEVVEVPVGRCRVEEGVRCVYGGRVGGRCPGVGVEVVIVVVVEGGRVVGVGGREVGGRVGDVELKLEYEGLCVEGPCVWSVPWSRYCCATWSVYCERVETEDAHHFTHFLVSLCRTERNLCWWRW